MAVNDIAFSHAHLQSYHSISSSNGHDSTKIEEKYHGNIGGSQQPKPNLDSPHSCYDFFVGCNFIKFPADCFAIFCCVSAFGLLFSANCLGVVILADETLLLLSGQDIKPFRVFSFFWGVLVQKPRIYKPKQVYECK